MAIVLAVPASFLVRRVTNDSGRADPVDSGRPAPAFSLPAVDGSTVSLADFAGKPTIVNFWGTYCEDCLLGLTRLVDARKRHPEIALVGILYRDEPEAGRAEAAAAGADWPQLTDADQAVARAYGVVGAPVTYFIGADGRVAGHMVGPLTDRLVDRQLRRIL